MNKTARWLLLACLTASLAGAKDQGVWDALSWTVVPFVVGSEGALALSGQTGRHEAWQGFKALAAATAEAQSLKLLTRERRPYRREFDSFPSGHTTIAFTMATVIDQYHPRYAVPAYLLAGTIGYARVRAHEHHWQDVFAGAALGYLNGRLFCHRHLALTPRGVTYTTQF